MPKIGTDDKAEGLELTSGFLAECLHRLRWRVRLKGNLTGRDRNAALSAANGLLELVYPGLVAGGAGAAEGTSIEEVPRASLRWALWMGLEARLRVRQQQHRIQPEVFDEGNFRLQVDPGSGETAEKRVFLPEEEDL